LRPLIEADGGKLYLVKAESDQLSLHLGGACSGCPGASLTIRTLIEPAARAIDPQVRVVVTVGAKRPENAVLVEAAEPSTDAGAQTGEVGEALEEPGSADSGDAAPDSEDPFDQLTDSHD